MSKSLKKLSIAMSVAMALTATSFLSMGSAYASDKSITTQAASQSVVSTQTKDLTNTEQPAIRVRPSKEAKQHKWTPEEKAKFKEHMQERQDKLFKKIDTNKNGVIERNEFDNFSKEHMKKMHEMRKNKKKFAHCFDKNATQGNKEDCKKVVPHE